MPEKIYLLICNLCGAECGDRDRAQGRCGSCGSFFTGDEQLIEHEVAAEAQTPASSDRPPAAPAPPVDTPEPVAETEEFSQEEPADSEALIKPRKLSPQFRRHIQMTWQPSLDDGEVGAHRTITDKSNQQATKRDSFWQSIGTRRVSPTRDDDGGDYKLKGVIGEGSMGRVWSARQTSLDRDVAVKIPLPEIASMGSTGESQFVSEVVVTGKLEHPNIVPIYELGRDTQGVPFYSMKHVQGQPWNELIEDKSEAENIEILMKVCDAIAFAHDRHFLHRDIKPHNVMVGEFGEVSVMDWGIAVSIKDDPERAWIATASGPAGTPAYMAPEMAAYNSSELGVVSDVYLLGAVLYEIVTGNPPHPCIGDTNDALVAAAANEIVPAGRNGELVDIARRAMATNLEDRYQSVKEFQDALREYQSHRQSIKLAESAHEHLASAKQSGRSDEFARARFAFEEALRLWSENTHAAQGMREATLAHAENALKQEDFELGISILDANNPAHRNLLSRLQSRRAQRQRQTRLARLAAVVTVVAVLVVMVVLSVAYLKVNEQVTIANQAVLDKEEARKQAARDAVVARAAEADADEQRQVAERQKERADDQRLEALRSERIAQAEERRAVSAKYVSEIGIAAASIRRNEFPKAARTVSDLADVGESINTLRHLEWGVLERSANPPVDDLLVEKQSIATVTSSTDGSVIAAGTMDGKILVWYRTTEQGKGEQLVRVLPDLEHGSRVNAIALSGDGRHLVSAGIDTIEQQAAADGGVAEDQQSSDAPQATYSVRLWETGGDQVKPVRSLSGHQGEIFSVCFSDDDDASYVLSSGADRAAIKWDRQRGTALVTIQDHLDKRVRCARFARQNPDRIVTACDDGRVRVWDIKSEGVQKTADFRGHTGPVYAAVFGRDGETVYSGGYGRRLLKWKVSEHKATRTSTVKDLLSLGENAGVDGVTVGDIKDQHESSIASLSIDWANGSDRIVSGGNDNTVRVWSQFNGSWRLEKTLRGHGRWVRDCVFSSDGERVVSGAADGVKRWNWKDYEVPRELYANSEQRLAQRSSEIGNSRATGLAVAPDGWVATAYQNGTVAVWNLTSGEKTSASLLGDRHLFLTATAIPFDGGRQLLTSASDNTTRLWEIDRGTQTTLLPRTGWRGAAAVHWRQQDGAALIVTGSDDRMIPAQLWQVKDGAVYNTPLLQEYSLTFLKKYLTDSTAELTGADLQKIRRERGKIPDVTAVSFSPSGDRFLVGNSAGECFVFRVDPETADASFETRFVATNRAPLRAAAFLPAGDFVVTAGSDGRVVKWDLNTQQAVQDFSNAGPVNSLQVSADGRWLLLGYAAVKGQPKPLLAQRFDLTSGDTDSSIKLEPSGVDLTGIGYDVKTQSPSVQSARFGDQDNRVILTLFFPTRTGQSRYQVGQWNLDGGDIERLEVATENEIAAASLITQDEQQRMLVVGGKGARLLAPDQPSGRRFTQLKQSFRPAKQLTAVGFAYDRSSATTVRMAVGDDEGNIHIWQFDPQTGSWVDNLGAGAQLVGRHDQPIAALRFDPDNKNRLLTADASGKWIWWNFDGSDWTDQQSEVPDIGEQVFHCVALSPDCKQVFLGADDHSRIYQSTDFELNDVRRQETGTVRAVSYADDSRLIATAESLGANEVICFRDRNGAELEGRIEDDEDAEGVTSMAWSWDQRRLITGNRDGDVIVWETSVLVDNEQPTEEVSPIEGLGERPEVTALLTLEDAQQIGMVAVAVSPNSRDILAADRTGRTILFAGAPITPVSLTGSSNQLRLAIGDAAQPVDPGLVLSDPNRLADFSQARAVVHFENQSEGRITNLDEIQAMFSADATALTIQAALRQLQCEIPERAAESTDIAVTGADASSTETDADPAPPKVIIELHDIQYRDGTESGPVSVEYKLEIQDSGDPPVQPTAERLTSIGD